MIVTTNRSKYDTKQRKMIMDHLIQNSDQYLTAETIAKSLSGCVGKTTVYRNLDCLVKEKIVIKIDMPDGKGAYYQYLNKPDNMKICHLLCTECGKVVDLNCNFISQLITHVQQEHQFKLDHLKTVLCGSCENCLGG